MEIATRNVIFPRSVGLEQAHPLTKPLAMGDSIYIYSCVQRFNDRRRRGVDGHRVSGDTAGSWFENRRFRSRKVGGATAERLPPLPPSPLRHTRVPSFLSR